MYVLPPPGLYYNALLTSTSRTNSTQKNPDDVVITLAVRTPLAKGGKGGLKDTEIDYMAYHLLKETLSKSKLDPNLIEDICCGNVSLPFRNTPYIASLS